MVDHCKEQELAHQAREWRESADRKLSDAKLIRQGRLSPCRRFKYADNRVPSMEAKLAARRLEAKAVACCEQARRLEAEAKAVAEAEAKAEEEAKAVAKAKARLLRATAAHQREDARLMEHGLLSADRLVRFDEPRAVTKEVMHAAVRLRALARRRDEVASLLITRRVTGHC